MRSPYWHNISIKQSDDACVLQSIGWMNEDFDFDEATIEADVTRYEEKGFDLGGFIH